ncbi:HrpE/YscL family type III secretion apparatus protein [Bordetella genomosp. 8]|uniref:HrpE/YscL family type III secretion apparatus protein n=1 Tax=Bordetella genomosp. 8 TaxID=1416806 RepID=UPI0012FE55EC|nr:HrpE/YscL family type III secretion apparatus protein [Bordetella genomosp. 8]
MGKIVRRDEHVAFLDAKDLLRRARDDAARLAEQAREAYRRERDRGHAEGLQAARVEQAAAMLSVAQQTTDYLRRIERDMADLVVTSVRRIVGDFDATDRALTVVRGGLAVLRRQKNVLLRMHTDDAAVVRQHMQALLVRFPGVDYLDVVSDDRLPSGTCRMETPIGTIETSVDKQLDVLQRALEIAVVDQGGPRPGAGSAQDDV